MRMVEANGINHHIREDGPADGAPIVFANSLGTDLRLWDGVVARLPENLRIIRYDLRGHGLTDAPKGPYAMGTLVRDAEALLDGLNIRDAVFVGLSIGGMIAQGLAVKRLDQVRALVLACTAAKIGTAQMWQDRIDAVQQDGLDAIADGVMERWFGRDFLANPDMRLWRNMLARQSPDGYAGCAAAISGTDFYTPTSGLRLPCLGIAGTEDGSTPPDLVRETVNLIPGAQFALMRRAGHLPCVENPAEFAELLTGFLTDTGHI